MSTTSYKGDSRKGRIELKEFIVLFFTVSVLIFFAVERIGIARKRAAREEARKTVAGIIVLQKRFSQEHGRYGNLSEIGFANPFHDNTIEYELNLENEFVITAKEAPLIDSYGDNLPGNEYYIGYPNGSIEYNKK